MNEDFLRLSSFMAVPLMVEDKIIGVSAVSKVKPGDQFDEAAFDRFKLLANFGTLAVSNFFSFLAANERSAIERSAGIAAEIQSTIIPKKLPQFPSLAIGAFTSPVITSYSIHYTKLYDIAASNSSRNSRKRRRTSSRN